MSTQPLLLLAYTLTLAFFKISIHINYLDGFYCFHSLSFRDEKNKFQKLKIEETEFENFDFFFIGGRLFFEKMSVSLSTFQRWVKDLDGLGESCTMKSPRTK